jgi:hypothetical protein
LQEATVLMRKLLPTALAVLVLASAVQAEELDDTVKALETLGATVDRDNMAPGRPVILIRASRIKLTDKDLASIQELTSLKYLFLGDTGVADADLGRLAGLVGLESLDIADTKATDKGLAHLQGLTRLHALNLSRTAVTGPGCETCRAWSAWSR